MCVPACLCTEHVYLFGFMVYICFLVPKGGVLVICGLERCRVCEFISRVKLWFYDEITNHGLNGRIVLLPLSLSFGLLCFCA